MTSTLNFVTTGSEVDKRGQTHSKTNTQEGDLLSLFLSFTKESRLKNETTF
jgi:hypothetical protein